MHSRRNFIGKVATGLAGSLAATSVLGANDRIRVGLLGAGDRGTQLLREAAQCSGVEVAAICDLYQRRLDALGQEFPRALLFQDYRRMLEEKSLDAVLIATPPHLHAEHFVASLDSGQHVYQEKTMAFDVADAKQMRAAFERAGGKRTVQIGHQACSSGHVADAASFLASGGVGQISFIHAHMFRNTPRGKPQWSRPVPPDITPESVAWQPFLGAAPARAFDANRFVNWRLFRDYSGGNVHENMCHQVAFWYKMLGLQVPRSAHMVGGVYLSQDGREVPDTMSVTLDQPENLLFTWDSGFGNGHLGAGEEVLGTNGSISRGQQIRYTAQKVNLRDAPDRAGVTASGPRAHMQNFLDCTRSGKAPNCPFELGYRVSIACRMAVESYLQGRTVRWDSAREEIV